MKKFLRTLSLIRLSFIELKIKKLQSKREKFIFKIVKNSKESLKMFLNLSESDSESLLHIMNELDNI